MTHDLWASLNQRMIEFLDSVIAAEAGRRADRQGRLDRGAPGQAGDLDASRWSSRSRSTRRTRCSRSAPPSRSDASPRRLTNRLHGHDPALPDLPRLRRDDAGRPARRRRDDPLAARALRQPGVAQPRLGLGSGRGGREGARAGRGADRRRPARDRLDLGRDRVEQPRAQGRGAVLQGARASTSSR